ncbi:MAG: response regulator [Nitrospirae bacterium]|nr:response regulator [Nitrospirota bacterium]
MDIAMPGGNGFTVAERLRDSTVTSDVPLIFLTASKQPGLREKAMAFDAQAFFEKPFKSDELIQSIRTCLQVSSSFFPA